MCSVKLHWHCCAVIMGAIASQITSLTIVYSTVYSGPDQRNHQSSASLALVRGIYRSPRKWPVMRKMFPFDDIIMGWTRSGVNMDSGNGTVLSGNKPSCEPLLANIIDSTWRHSGLKSWSQYPWHRTYPAQMNILHVSQNATIHIDVIGKRFLNFHFLKGFLGLVRMAFHI